MCLTDPKKNWAFKIMRKGDEGITFFHIELLLGRPLKIRCTINNIYEYIYNLKKHIAVKEIH